MVARRFQFQDEAKLLPRRPGRSPGFGWAYVAESVVFGVAGALIGGGLCGPAGAMVGGGIGLVFVPLLLILYGLYLMVFE